MGFLKAFCCTLDEKQLAEFLIPQTSCKRQLKRDDVEIYSQVKNEAVLDMNTEQLLKVFQMVN